MALLAGNNFWDFIAILLIFVFVLGLTLVVTKWMASYQKNKGTNGNIELLDCAQISNNKYIQVVRVGETFFAVAVCKDTVTMLGEIPKDQLQVREVVNSVQSFKDIFKKASLKQTEGIEEPKDDATDEES